jgi:ectoine hydroxylase-related dioxygenase (phytanoyl-CoA dioxygenase family)
MTIKAELLASGFALVSSVFTSTDLCEIDTIVNALIARWAGGNAGEDYWSFYNQEAGREVLYRIHNLERKHSCFREMFQNPAFHSLIGDVMAEPSTPTACALIYKMPLVGAQVPWHRDPLDVPAGNVFNFSVFLDPSDAENGALAFVPGSHRADVTDPECSTSGAVTVCSGPGDALIHDVRVFHGSSESRSSRCRRSIVFEVQPLRLEPEPIFPGLVIRG